MALGVFVIANDFTTLSVAIPNIEGDLNTTLTKAQWVINGYALVFGVLIVTGGRLADLFGRKRIFMIGAAIFAGFSLLAGLMPGVGLGSLYNRGRRPGRRRHRRRAPGDRHPLLSFLDADYDVRGLVPGMIVLGVGVGLFYSAITTTAVTALDPSRSSLAGGSVRVPDRGRRGGPRPRHRARHQPVVAGRRHRGVAFKVDAVHVRGAGRGAGVHRSPGAGGGTPRPRYRHASPRSRLTAASVGGSGRAGKLPGWCRSGADPFVVGVIR